MRACLAVSVVLSIGCAAAAHAASPADWNDCEQKPDPDRGIVGCTRVIEAADDIPQNLATAYYNRGVAYGKKRDRAHAIADYSEAIRIDPQSEHAYANRGMLYLNGGEPDRAIADFNQAIRMDANFAPLYDVRGGAYRAKGEFDRAIADYDEAIAIDPKLDPAYGNRGNAYRAKGELEAAIADYDAAIRLNPGDPFTYRNRGVAKLYGGALADALADLSRASELEPEFAPTALWLEIANRRSDMPSRLAQASAHIDMARWPAPAIALFLGRMTPDALIAAANDPDAYTKRRQLCQAHFFSAELALSEQRKGDARPLLERAAADCPRGTTEWSAAVAELKALGVDLSRP
jgi:tetratricopeptide (TPR) repeat protein